MRNIKLLIEYDGTTFAGWQEQRVPTNSSVASTHQKDTSTPHSYDNDSKPPATVPTIQSCLMEAIHSVTGERVVVYGASRTDAGVHATGQVANFKTTSRLPVEKFVPALNYYLPREIVVRSAEEVPDEFHSQYHARSKVYRYTILNDPIPRAINRYFYYHYPCPLNIEKLQEAAQFLFGTHDFSTFCTEVHNKKNTIRTIKSIEITQEDPTASCEVGKYLYFIIEADGFLHKMIRGIVGTLLLVGCGKMSPSEFKDVLKAKDRRLAGPNVPAKGLCLVKVNYEETGKWMESLASKEDCKPLRFL